MMINLILSIQFGENLGDLHGIAYRMSIQYFTKLGTSQYRIPRSRGLVILCQRQRQRQLILLSLLLLLPVYILY